MLIYFPAESWQRYESDESGINLLIQDKIIGSWL